MIVTAGYSEDSDYTSDVNFPVNGQFPNAATSQYLQVRSVVNFQTFEPEDESHEEFNNTPDLCAAQVAQHLGPGQQGCQGQGSADYYDMFHYGYQVTRTSAWRCLAVRAWNEGPSEDL